MATKRFTLTLLLLLTRLAHGYVTTESSDFPSVSVEPGLELGSEVLEQHRAGSTTGRRPGRECSCSPLPMPERVRTEVKEMECRCLGDAFVDIPDNISTFMCRLTVSDAGIKLLRSTALQPYRETLRDLTLANIWQLREIQPGTFENMLQLRTIYIYKAPLLVSVATSVFNVALPRLKILRIVHTGLVEVPAFAGLQTDNILNMVDLENNQIHHITSGSISVKAEQLLLNYNLIERVEAYAFNGSQLAKLSLKGNRALTHLHRDAFVGLQSLQHLDLSRTSITALPTNGLQELEVLRLQDTTTVKVFPSIYRFEAIREAWLTYPYHCCAFHYPATHDLVEYNKHQEFLQKMSHHCSRRRRSAQGPWGPMGLETLNETKSSWGPLGGDPDPKPFDTESDGTFHQEGILLSPGTVHAMCGNLSKNYHDVRCFPAPDAFNPCEDLMGNWALRTAVWIVAVAALVGNLAVLLVLLSSRFRMTVPKFLMVNLALADLCMGLYLLMIAAMDAQSIGDYFNHAIYWQSGLGCKVAGFLTVFASELSIFTLAIITSERWYTITYAMHLNKRLRLSSAVKIMTLGWAYAITMATLPLVGVSGYSKTSICLPMENNEFVDLVYLFLLLTLNGLAFFLICACYGRMYCSIRRGQDMLVAQTRSDMTVAKRMALLVFTDFACWAPIAFFGLTALAGYPLIDVPHTKILLVFFYPLNSCANPYLYALLTQQYRRDTFVLLSRYGVCTRRAMAYKIGGIGHIPRLSQPTPVDKSKTPNHRGSLQTTFTSVDNTKAITLSTNPIVIRRPLSPSPCGLGDGCLGPQSSVL